MKKIQNLNPTYKMVLFDDDDIEKWIKENFESDIIYATYKKLKIGAGKADFWRYLILYVNGGVYLDIDSNINKPLDSLIQEDDQAIITREKNSGTDYFVQWCLMFSPKHPILLNAINICIYNINNKTTTRLEKLTGPGAFTLAINNFLKKYYSYPYKVNLFHLSDEYLNSIFNNKENEINCRFFGKDYNDFCSYDNKCKSLILGNSLYWKNDKEIFAK